MWTRLRRRVAQGLGPLCGLLTGRIARRPARSDCRKRAGCQLGGSGRRSAALLCVAALMLAPVAPPAPARAAVPDRIIIVDDKSYPPFAFLDAGGAPRGITVDLWNLWSRKTGIAVEFHLMEWEAALAAVREGRADVVGGLFRTPEREADFEFTQPLFKIPTGIFFHRDIFGIKNLGDLAGFEVGVIKGDSTEETLRARHPERLAALVAMNTAAFPKPAAKRLPWGLWLARHTALGAFLVRRTRLFCRLAARWCVCRLQSDIR